MYKLIALYKFMQITYKSLNSQKYFYLFFILRTFIIYTSLLRRVIIFILESAWHLQRVMTNFVA